MSARAYRAVRAYRAEALEVSAEVQEALELAAMVMGYDTPMDLLAEIVGELAGAAREVPLPRSLFGVFAVPNTGPDTDGPGGFDLVKLTTRSRGLGRDPAEPRVVRVAVVAT